MSIHFLAIDRPHNSCLFPLRIQLNLKSIVQWNNHSIPQMHLIKSNHLNWSVTTQPNQFWCQFSKKFVHLKIIPHLYPHRYNIVVIILTGMASNTVYQEPMSRSMQLHYISFTAFFIDRFIFRSNLLWMRLPWECHNQSQDTNWRHCVTGPELPFFHKRKSVLKIDQSVKMPWHRHSMGIASSCSSAPAYIYITYLSCPHQANSLKPQWPLW